MSDTEFDHDAAANEYHIAVKQHLYERIRELEARVRELEAEAARLWTALTNLLNANARREHEGMPREEWDAIILATEDALAGEGGEATHGNDG